MKKVSKRERNWQTLDEKTLTLSEWFSSHMIFMEEKNDGRLAPAYSLPSNCVIVIFKMPIEKTKTFFFQEKTTFYNFWNFSRFNEFWFFTKKNLQIKERKRLRWNNVKWYAFTSKFLICHNFQFWNKSSFLWKISSFFKWNPNFARFEKF